MSREMGVRGKAGFYRGDDDKPAEPARAFFIISCRAG